MSTLESAPLRTCLRNGLSVVCVPLPALHSASMSLHLRVGPRFESRELNGLSHFVEHMLFRGTPSFSTAHEQALAFEQLGGTLYAATHTDFGTLSLRVPPENLLAAFELFTQIVTAPRFGDIEVERAIIREEILESLDDDGHQVDPDNLSHALMFGDHPLGFPITGDLDRVAEFDRDQLTAFHKQFYTARNAVLCFAGAIDPQQCAQAAEQHLGNMPSGQRAAADPARWLQRHPRFRFVDNPSSQTDLRLAFRAPGNHHELEPATELLVRLLDDGMSTRLYARICDELGLCYDVSGDYEAFEDDGVLDLAALVQHARAPVVMRELCGLVRAMAADGPTALELDKAKARHRWESQVLVDDAEATAAFYGVSALSGLAPTPEQRDEEIQSVSAEQVRDAARLIFRPERLSAVAVGVLEPGDRREIEQIVRGFGCG